MNEQRKRLIGRDTEHLRDFPREFGLARGYALHVHRAVGLLPEEGWLVVGGGWLLVAGWVVAIIFVTPAPFVALCLHN